MSLKVINDMTDENGLVQQEQPEQRPILELTPQLINKLEFEIPEQEEEPKAQMDREHSEDGEELFEWPEDIQLNVVLKEIYNFRMSEDEKISTQSSGEISAISQTQQNENHANELECALEKSLAIIKPIALEFCHEIERCFLEEGFSIVNKRTVHLSADQAAEFYWHHRDHLDYPKLVYHLTYKPIKVYCLAKQNAIKHLLSLIHTDEPLRTRHVLNSVYAKIPIVGDNLPIHASADRDNAAREIRFFFEGTIVEPIQLNGEAWDYLNSVLNKILANGLAELCRVKPLDPIEWLADWLLNNNPNKPKHRFRPNEKDTSTTDLIGC